MNIFKILFLFLILALPTSISFGQGGVVAEYLRLFPEPLPTICHQGDVRFDSMSSFLEECTTTNTWTSIAQGNFIYPLTTLGDTLYDNGTAPHGSRLAGNITTTKKFLNQIGTGSVSAAPAWGTIDASDIATGVLSVPRGGLGTGSAPANGQVPIGNGSTYTLSTLTPGSNISIVNAPGSITISSTGGGGGTGTANNIDLMIHKAQEEHLGLFTNPLPQGVFSSFQAQRYSNGYAQLIEDYTSPATQMRLVFNVVHLDYPSDQSTDSATHWSVGGDAASVTTSNTAKVGTKSLSFTTGNSQTTSFIKIAPTNQPAVSQNTKLYFWFQPPSVTNLAAVRIQVCQESGLTNCAFFDLTTDEQGGSFSAATWSFMLVDIAGTPTSTTGTGWIPSQPIGGFAAGITKTSAGTVFTGVLLDAFAFADSTGLYAAIGDELTIHSVNGFSNPNLENVVIDATSLNFQGTIVIPALAHSYTSILDQSGPILERSTMQILGGGRATPFTGGSGGIVNTQTVRLKKYLSQALAGATVTAAIAFDDDKILRVVSVGGGNVVLDDPGDHHLLFVSGNKIRAIQVGDNDGVEQYKPRSVNPSLTGNATFGSNQTTLPVSSTTSIAVGDIIIKDQLSPSISVVTTSPVVNETYNAMTFQKLEVVNDATPIPQKTSVFAHWFLGGFGTVGAQNQVGPGANLTENGTIPKTNAFFRRQLSAGPFSTSNYYSLSPGQSAGFVSDTLGAKATYSVWVNFASLAVDQVLWDFGNIANGQGIQLVYQTAPNKVSLYFNGANPVQHSTTFTANTWYNIQATFGGVGSTLNVLEVNGSDVVFTQPATTQTGSALRIGIDYSTNPMLGKEADFAIWSDILTQASRQAIYTNGVFRPLGSKDSFFTYWTAVGLTGDKFSFKADNARTTDADNLYFTIMGATQ